MELNQSEKMLFALLCSALNTIPVNSALFADVSLLSWQSCYKLAVEPVSYTHLRAHET